MQSCHHSEVFCIFKMELEKLCNLSSQTSWVGDRTFLGAHVAFIGSCNCFFINSAFLYDCLLFLNRSMRQFKSVVVIRIKGLQVQVHTSSRQTQEKPSPCLEQYRGYSVLIFFTPLTIDRRERRIKNKGTCNH